MRDRTAGRRWSISITAAGVLLAVLGVVWWAHSDRSQAESARGAALSARLGTTARPAPAQPIAGAPRRLRIPDLHVDAAVLPVRAPAGTLVPPRDPRELGWWAGGALPGAAHGRTLIAGHTVHDGGGALDHLAELRVGDPLVVTTAHARLSYRVARVLVLPKGLVAARARRLFSPTGPPRLVVVTCSRWNGVRYLSNTVVTARPSR